MKPNKHIDLSYEVDFQYGTSGNWFNGPRFLKELLTPPNMDWSNPVAGFLSGITSGGKVRINIHVAAE